MYKIMIVEDDPAIAGVVSRHLGKWGYEVVCVEDFSSVHALFAQEEPQLVLMDISLPFYDGFYWCSQIRKSSRVPIIFISSADENMNLVMAINMGADDFIAKPFTMEVLTAKVLALLRRTYDFVDKKSTLLAGGVTLHLEDSRAEYENKSCELTRNEFRILKLLMEHKGSIVSRDAIMRSLWEDEAFIDDNTLTVNMTRIRRKLEELGCQEFIRTKKGMGYLVCADDGKKDGGSHGA